MKPSVRGHQFLAFFARSLICFLEAGSLKSYGVLVEDLTKQTNMSFAMAGLILPIQHSLSYFLAPLATALCNRVGQRTTVMFGGLLTGVGYVGNGILPLKPIFLTIFCTCAGAGYGIVQTPSYLNLRAAFADDSSFGIVQTLTDQFLFVGISILPLVFERFKQTYGLQGALLLFGGLNLHIMIGGTIMTSHGNTQESRTHDDHLRKKDIDSRTNDGSEKEMILEMHEDRKALGKNTSSVDGKPHRETVHNKSRDQTGPCSRAENYGLFHYFYSIKRNKAVIFLIMTVLSTSFTSFGWILFLVPLGKEKGLLPSQAVLLSTSAGLGALFGRVWCIMLLWKRTKRPFYYFGLPALLQCLTFICLSQTANDFSMLTVLSFISGVPFGVTGAAVGSVCALKVSTPDFSTALVVVYIFIAFGTELGGGVCGAVYDYTSSSVAVFFVLALSNMCLFSTSAIWSMWERCQE